MARGAVLITYAEVIGKKPSMSDLQTVLAKYQRIQVITLLGKLNCLLDTWRNDPSFDLDTQLSDYMLPDYRLKIREIRKGPVKRIAFARLTLLYLIKHACLLCPESGGHVGDRNSLQEMGVCCLMANDLVLLGIPSARDSTIQKATSLMPFADYVAHDEYPSDIARTLFMFEEVAEMPEVRKQPNFLDLPTLFQACMGMSHREFCALIFGCATRYFGVKKEELRQSPNALFLGVDYFRNTVLPSESVRQFFHKVAVTEEQFAKRICESSGRPGDDLTLIQRYPLIEVTNGTYMCLDPGFLVEKAGRALYWSLFTEIPQRETKDQLSSFWGTVFEEYINYILSSSYSAGGHFVPSPRFRNGDRAFDACLLEGRDLIVFEHKSSVLRADAKYGGNVAKLEQQLRLKFVEGHEEGKKGLAQLNNHLRRFLEGEPVGGIDRENVGRIYPVLVCLDRSLVRPFMGRYLDEKFREGSPKKFPQVITPLFTMSVNDIENLLPYLQTTNLSAILESYYSNNKHMLTSISSSSVPILKHARRGKDVIGEKFSNFAKQMEKELFGGKDGKAAGQDS